MGADGLRGMRQLLTGLGLGGWMLVAGAGPLPAAAEGFGRWETSLNQCQLEHRSADGHRQSGEPSCRSLRLDQTIEGLLSARFLANGQELVFAGSLATGQRPMRCNNDGLCTPEWPTQLIVQTVAHAALDNRGLPVSMPRARVAKGQCTIQKRQIQCQAQAGDGEEWRASSAL